MRNSLDLARFPLANKFIVSLQQNSAKLFGQSISIFTVMRIVMDAERICILAFMNCH